MSNPKVGIIVDSAASLPIDLPFAKPSVVPLTIILSTVKVVRVPKLVTLPCAAVAKVPVNVPVTVRLSAIVVSDVV